MIEDFNSKSSNIMTGNVIQFIGEIDSDLDFTYGPYEWDISGRGEGVRTVGSCSAILNDEMYVFGGQFVKHQVIIVITVNVLK